MKPPRPVSGLAGALSLLGAAPPNVDLQAALRAWARGTASEAQQRLAFAYVTGELAGVGRVTFTGDSDGTAFRSGAQAVGIVLLAMADALVAHVPRPLPGHSPQD